MLSFFFLVFFIERKLKWRTLIRNFNQLQRIINFISKHRILEFSSSLSSVVFLISSHLYVYLSSLTYGRSLDMIVNSFAHMISTKPVDRYTRPEFTGKEIDHFYKKIVYQ